MSEPAWSGCAAIVVSLAAVGALLFLEYPTAAVLVYITACLVAIVNRIDKAEETRRADERARAEMDQRRSQEFLEALHRLYERLKK
jgi:hypothetical protein